MKNKTVFCSSDNFSSSDTSCKACGSRYYLHGSYVFYEHEGFCSISCWKNYFNFRPYITVEYDSV